MDYKEQIEELRFLSGHIPEQMCDDDGKDPLERAVDSIETLLAERDAAAADLNRMYTLCMDIGGLLPEHIGQLGDPIDELLDSACMFCKEDGFLCWTDDPENQNRCAAFQWRDPQKESGSDE